MRLLVLAATAACTAAFLPPLRLPAAAPRTAAAARKAGAAAPLRMSSLFLDENALADRIKDGLLIRYLPEVRLLGGLLGVMVLVLKCAYVCVC